MNAFELGITDGMEKEAIIGLARRALGRAAMGVAGGAESALAAVAKRSGGSIGNVAARGAAAAGQSARASARAIDASNLAAKAKATRSASLKAMTPEARVRALAAAPKPTAAATPLPTATGSVVPGKPKPIVKPKAGMGIKGKLMLGGGALAGGSMLMGAGSGAQRVLQSEQAPAHAYPPGY